ncbi:MAG: glycosyltransferase [Planctomycetaceae bacterium]
MNPTVSVVIATYNYGRFLKESIDSVLAQTLTDYEIIVIDDGSTDDTSEVIRPYLEHEKISYHLTDHVGQPRAKNAGIQRARGRFVAFLDADDSWYPDKLEKQLALFGDDKELGVTHTQRLLMNEEGELIPSWHAEVYSGWVLDHLFCDNFVCFSTAMVRREVFDKVGLFDERIPLAIDWDLWLRAALYFRFDNVPEVLALHRTGHANLSRRREERFHVALGIRHRFLDEHGGKSRFDARTVRRRLAGTKINIAYMARQRSRCSSMAWYFRAVVTDPSCWDAWRGMAVTCLPDPIRRLLRPAHPSDSIP